MFGLATSANHRFQIQWLVINWTVVVFVTVATARSRRVRSWAAVTTKTTPAVRTIAPGGVFAGRTRYWPLCIDIVRRRESVWQETAVEEEVIGGRILIERVLQRRRWSQRSELKLWRRLVGVCGFPMILHIWCVWFMRSYTCLNREEDKWRNMYGRGENHMREPKKTCQLTVRIHVAKWSDGVFVNCNDLV